MDCRIDHFYQLPHDLFTSIVNLSTHESTIKCLNKGYFQRILNIKLQNIQLQNIELDKLCDTFKASVLKGNKSLPTVVFMRLVNRIHDTLRYLEYHKTPPYDASLKARLAWELEHYKDFVSLINAKVNTSDVSTEDLITLGEIYYELEKTSHCSLKSDIDQSVPIQFLRALFYIHLYKKEILDFLNTNPNLEMNLAGFIETKIGMFISSVNFGHWMGKGDIDNTKDILTSNILDQFLTLYKKRSKKFKRCIYLYNKFNQ